MARRSFNKVGLNTNLMIDVGIASLIVQKLPALVNRFLFSGNPVTGQTATLVGVAGAYLYGMFLKNNNVTNAGIALGAVEFVSPFIDQLLEGIVGDTTAGAIMPPIMQPKIKKPSKIIALDEYFGMSDYGSLNDYIYNPDQRQSYSVYKDSY